MQTFKTLFWTSQPAASASPGPVSDKKKAKMAEWTQLDELRAMADARQPYSLVDALGRNWGRWRIEKVTEDQSRVIDDGTAQVIDWTLELKEFVNASSEE